MEKKNNFLKKLFSGFSRKKNTVFKKGRASFDLIIYDDIYPHPSAGFRLEEFTYLLENIENSKIILSGSAYQIFKLTLQEHENHINNFNATHKHLVHKLEKIDGTININCKLFYCIFLNNIYQYLGLLEKNKIPFVFTLYPGGGFVTDNDQALTKLKKVLSSKYFQKVIVTQKRTYNYLLENKLCHPDNIVFIFGVVVPQTSLLNESHQKKYYPKSKMSFDICFCATKFTKFGEDKGYPLFVDFMKATSVKYPDVRFHIIGGFDKTVIDVSSIEDRTTFYGYQDFIQLKNIFSAMDLILSPNQPDKLQKGAFDGFPLGTVIEAALNEVAVMLTDCFNENIYFEDGKELIIIESKLQDMMNKFDHLMNDPDEFYKIAKAGKDKFKYLYSNEYQMKPRIGLINSILEK